MPFPAPDAPVVIVTQAADDAAVHAQPTGVVTLIVPVLASDVTEALVGDIVNEQLTPACVTVNVWPATVIVPVRVRPAAFAATLKPTLPVPLPVPPEVTVIHDALVTAVHAQPEVAVTVNELVPPSAPSDTLEGDTL